MLCPLLAVASQAQMYGAFSASGNACCCQLTAGLSTAALLGHAQHNPCAAVFADHDGAADLGLNVMCAASCCLCRLEWRRKNQFEGVVDREVSNTCCFIS
jgi:hypothetical protein